MGSSALVEIVVPVFCFIGLGYLLIASGLLNERVGDALADFVFTVPLPLLLFRAMGTLEVPDINPWPFWLAYFGGVAVNMVLGIAIIRIGFKRDAHVGVIAAMCTSYSNVVMVGLPVVTKAFGDAGLVTVLLLIAVHLPIMMTVTAIMIEVTEVRGLASIGAALRRVVISLLKNPFIVAILAGLAFRATGLPLEGVPRTVIDSVSDTAIPLALIALGMSLRKYGVRGNVLPAIAIGSVKLAVMPVVVFLLARYVFDLPPIATAVIVVCAACPTGANAYLMANRFQTGLALSANAITLTTAVAVLTLGAWLSLFVTG